MKMSEALKGGAAALVLVATAACGGTATDKPAAATVQIELPEITVTDAELEGNPFRAEWIGPYGVPPFADIKNEHFKPAILKGILDEEDARRAADFGADAIIVSNHGGRQLDGALSSIRMLPSIVRAVGDQVEVHMDSGIRSGQDVLKALALGATGTYIGRSFIYGLGAMGEAGVTRALEVIHKELDTSMALCGERDVKPLGRHNLLIPEDFEGRWA